MPEIFTPHNEYLMPIKMGSPRRVPSYAYRNWNLPYQGEYIATLAYKAEWQEGTAAQLGLVSQATLKAGFGDYPELLRQKTAEVVASKLAGANSTTLLDIGAGPGQSTLAVYNALPPRLKGLFSAILVEPSIQALKTAELVMAEHNITAKTLPGTDLETLGGIESSSVDVLIAVASVHHHADIPFWEYAKVLKPGGLAVFADWHHDIWEHPARVLKFLERFDWPAKSRGLANWIETYSPQSLEDPDKDLQLTPEELTAREQITRFWLAYKELADTANLGPNAIWPLEGHRPVARYIQNLQSAGFVVDSSQQLLPNSNLLMVTIARKPK